MQDRGILARLETGEDGFFFHVCFWEYQLSGLISMRGYNYMVVYFRLSVGEMEAYSAVVVVCDALDWGIQE